MHLHDIVEILNRLAEQVDVEIDWEHFTGKPLVQGTYNMGSKLNNLSQQITDVDNKLSDLYKYFKLKNVQINERRVLKLVKSKFVDTT